MRLTESERGVLKFAETYGPKIDFGGRGSSPSKRKAAQSCLDHGLLSGQVRSASITDLGRAALAQSLEKK